MASRGDNVWEDDYEVYSASQVEAVLAHCGVEVVSETGTHFLCYCPFHGNTDSPALAVDKVKGLFTCFNPSCMVSGTILNMLHRIMGYNQFQCFRTVLKYKNSSTTSFEQRYAEAAAKIPEFVEFGQDKLDELYNAFKGSVGEEYMRGRGFKDETLDYFRVGYAAKNNMVIVPMHDPKGMPVGLIGRTASARKEDKRFKNSNGLPKSKTAWNFHRAKRTGDTVIICEASYDAMRIHQAGYPNVIALLGGHVTDYHLDQINKHFSTVIIMTDFDKKQYRPNCRMCSKIQFKPNEVKCRGHRPGRDLGRSIATRLPNKRILWAAYDEACVYPHGAKDASDMTDTEIHNCLTRAISNVEYEMWEIEEVENLVAS